MTNRAVWSTYDEGKNAGEQAERRRIRKAIAPALKTIQTLALRLDSRLSFDAKPEAAAILSWSKVIDASACAPRRQAKRRAGKGGA